MSNLQNTIYLEAQQEAEEEKSPFSLMQEMDYMVFHAVRKAGDKENK